MLNFPDQIRIKIRTTKGKNHSMEKVQFSIMFLYKKGNNRSKSGFIKVKNGAG